MRAMCSAAVTALTVTLGCGDGGNGPNLNQFVGTWDATKLEFTNKANPAQKVEVIALGGAFVAVLANDGTYQFSITMLGEAPQVQTGTWSVSNDIISFRESGTWVTEFNWSLSGNTLTLSGGDVDFDFNDDGVDEPAEVGGVLVRR